MLNPAKRPSRFSQQLRRSRITLYSLLPFLALAAANAGGIFQTIQPALKLIYIVAGFSLIIFLHELGHFVVARLCSVKCLAFSIGIGPRMCGWRSKGKFSLGNDPYDPDTMKKNALRNEKTLAEKEDEKYAADILGKAKLEVEGAATQSDLPQSATVPAHPTNVGDCDYRISWLPLGGYVRMLGQDDMDPTKISTDPHAFNQRPIWQRMCIVSAGVIMNLIFAAVCFSIIFSPGIGVDFPPARLGVVQYDSPAWKAGLRPGDEVLSINGESPRGFLEFTDIQMYSALSSGSDKLHFKVRHAKTGIEDTVDILPVRSDSSGFLAIGVESMPGTKIVGTGDDYKKAFDDMAAHGDPIPAWMTANKASLLALRKDDRIMAVDDTDIHGKYMELNDYVQTQNGKPVSLHLTNVDPSLPPQTVTFQPHLEPRLGAGEFPSVMGLSPRLIIGTVQDKSPAAAAGFKPGDRILQVGDRKFPSAKQLTEITRNSGGQPLDVTLERVTAGKADSKIFHVSAKQKEGVYRIGVGPIQEIDSLTFIPPAGDSAAAALGLPADATISKIDGTPVQSWEQIYTLLKTKSAGTVNVTFLTSAGEVTHPLPFTQDERGATQELLVYQLGIHLEIETKTQVAANAGQAVLMGMDHTKKFILNVYMTLAGLFRGTVDPSNLHGIVGITKVGYDVQERGTVWLWYVLAMVSVNLAVANFLPLPIVDGGLFLLLILEKIRGKPLSLKVQSVIQTVGIVLLASLFLFVTMNDIKLF